jgi:hypothetical protein
VCNATSAFSSPTLWPKCSTLLTEMLAESPGVKQLWPWCLYHSFASASQS